jgi:predicted MFS family arabinose efflux permease
VKGPAIAILRQRDFRLLWTGETTSCLGSSVGGVALPLAALSVLHAGVFAVSALTAAAWLPWVLIGLPAGAWVDRLPRRRVMIIADLFSLAVFASVPVAAWYGRLSVAQVLIVALAAGTAGVFFKTAYRAFLPAVLEPGQLLEGNAKLQGSEQVTNVTGPGLAGLIAQAAGAVCGVLADAASFAVSAICLSRIHVSEPEPAAERRSLRREIAEGLSIVLRDPLLRVSAIYGCLSNFMLVGYQAVLVVFLIRTVGLSAGLTGLLLTLTSLGGVLGALLARRAASRFGTARVALYSKVLLFPAGLLIPLTSKGPGLALFVLGSVTVVAGVVSGNIVWSGFTQARYPARLLGRVSTSTQVFNYGAIPAGALVAGAIASQLGVRPALWIMIGGLVASTFVLLLGPLPHLRDLPAEPLDPVSAAADRHRMSASA